MNLPSTRIQRWGAIVTGVVVLYAAIGFWAVPAIVKNQVPKYGHDVLERNAQVGEVRFNPFTLRFEAEGLSLAEKTGAPVLGVGKLAVELQWRSLLRRAWSFAEIRVTAPSANLLIEPDGRFNLAELIATFERRPHEASTDQKLPRLVIEHFALEQGKVDMQDRRAGYANVFTPVNFTLDHFSTLPEQDDTHTFTAQSARGGKLRWKGHASLNPIHATGEVTLEDVSLPDSAVYLKTYTRARVAAGRLSATLPYEFSYADGKFNARIAGARLSLRDLALAREGVTDSFAALSNLEVKGIDADLVKRDATIAEVKAEGGKLTMKRDPKGELDLANLMVAGAGPAATQKGVAVVVDTWKLAVKQVVFDQVAISAVDETVSPALRVGADKLRLQLALEAGQEASGLQLKIVDLGLAVAGLAVANGAQPALKIAELTLAGGSLDLAARRAGAERLSVSGGQLQIARDRAGKLSVMDLVPKFTSSPTPVSVPTAPGPQWSADIKTVELNKFGADMSDQASGIAVHATDITAKLEGAGSDLGKPVKFTAGFNLREGGQFAAQGNVVPANAAVQADVRIRQLALAPLQPLLAQHLKLKIASGQLTAQGKISTGSGSAKSPALRYSGAMEVANLLLNEEDGDPFAAWKSVGTDRFHATINPNLVEIPELRVVEANAKLIIENDRSLNAARLLVQPAVAQGIPAPPAAPATSTSANDPFPVQVRRIRLQNARLEFTDLSLRPQFSAKIHELNGLINGMSSSRDSRSLIELDGRVDEFGLARIRGELNPFAPRNNTDVNVVFRNVDMVAASPYTMKFAGYRIAEGKISLDLQYKVRSSQLEGANQIVIDKLTLGERVDSPDAMKIPLELAIALLKDSDGRIDLGLPVSGNLDDPQFSYGALIWKVIGNVLTKIVTAPFRAIGALLGVGGEKLESIDFDSGSAKLLPPEREKIKQVAQLLAKRPQLKLSVPGQFSEAADGTALKTRLVRDELARRSGTRLEAGEEPGPVDIGSRSVRSALREMYAARFGDAELDKQKKAAEAAAVAPAAAASGAASAGKPESAQPQLPIWQRVGKMIQGEPQVADPAAFYNHLLDGLIKGQPLQPEALTALGTQRAEAIVGALKDAGVDASRAVATPPEKIASDLGKAVPLKLALGAK